MPYEQGSFGTHFESLWQYDPHDPESVKGEQEYSLAHAKRIVETKQGLPYWEFPAELPTGVTFTDYFVWLEKIKKAFDPNVAAMPGWGGRALTRWGSHGGSVVRGSACL